MLANSGNKFQIIKHQPNDSSYERLTLESLRSFAKADDFILYVHSKGVKYTDTQWLQLVGDWRRYMSYHTIKDWRKCVQFLENGSEVVGANFQTEPERHFSGNFWWARGDYIRTLPEKIGNQELDPEMYICQAAKTVTSLSNSNVNHYRSLYPLSRYVDRVDKNETTLHL